MKILGLIFATTPRTNQRGIPFVLTPPSAVAAQPCPTSAQTHRIIPQPCAIRAQAGWMIAHAWVTIAQPRAIIPQACATILQARWTILQACGIIPHAHPNTANASKPALWLKLIKNRHSSPSANPAYDAQPRCFCTGNGVRGFHLFPVPNH